MSLLHIKRLRLNKTDQQLITALQLLGDTSRYKMFRLLCLDDSLCVSEIAQKLDISVSAVSQHFRQFEMAGMVTKQRTGQKICYQLTTKNSLVQKLAQLITLH